MKKQKDQHKKYNKEKKQRKTDITVAKLERVTTVRNLVVPKIIELYT